MRLFISIDLRPSLEADSYSAYQETAHIWDNKAN
jgi:2-phosphoglycerate kinase